MLKKIKWIILSLLIIIFGFVLCSDHSNRLAEFNRTWPPELPTFFGLPIEYEFSAGMLLILLGTVYPAKKIIDQLKTKYGEIKAIIRIGIYMIVLGVLICIFFFTFGYNPSNVDSHALPIGLSIAFLIIPGIFIIFMAKMLNQWENIKRAENNENNSSKPIRTKTPSLVFYILAVIIMVISFTYLACYSLILGFLGYILWPSKNNNQEYSQQ
jgi:hypothetical protein